MLETEEKSETLVFVLGEPIFNSSKTIIFSGVLSSGIVASDAAGKIARSGDISEEEKNCEYLREQLPGSTWEADYYLCQYLGGYDCDHNGNTHRALLFTLHSDFKDLDEWLATWKRLSDDPPDDLGYQLAFRLTKALGTLHGKFFAHGDVEGRNVLVSLPAGVHQPNLHTALLLDFGSGKRHYLQTANFRIDSEAG